MKNFAAMIIRGNRRRGRRRRRREIQRVQNEPNEAREQSESDECRRQSLLSLFAAEITHVHATTKVSFAVVVEDDDGRCACIYRNKTREKIFLKREVKKKKKKKKTRRI